MRLIDADALLEAMKKDDKEYPELSTYWSRGSISRTIKLLPTVDAAPVVHGYWTKDDLCSECGADIPSDSWRDYIDKSECHYCYSCGAKMDGGENDG